MARIKINNLPKDYKLDPEQMKQIRGGWDTKRAGSGLGFLANPLVLAGIVAAAIAIPLAHASDDDDAS